MNRQVDGLQNLVMIFQDDTSTTKMSWEPGLDIVVIEVRDRSVIVRRRDLLAYMGVLATVNP
jgi:hypothetical protein